MAPRLALALLALALLAAAALAFALWRIRQRRRRARAPRVQRLRYPVVLAHGVLGFEQIELGSSRHEYFRNVVPRIEQLGASVYKTSVPAVGSVAARSEVLAQFIRQLPSPKVNIVAHSMGGLDARYAISRLGLADRVASLTTIGTPHQGTPLADLGTDLLGEKLMLRKALGALGIRFEAFYDLTTARMEGFNREVPNARGVAYASVVAAVKASAQVNPLLWPTHRYLNDRAGANDGMVPAASQRWGEVIREIEADHWAQIGWSSRFDSIAFYEALIRELRGRGF